MNDFMSGYNTPQIKMPTIDPPVIDTPIQHIFVDEQFEIIKKYIQEYESQLDTEHEVGIKLTNFGQSIVMQVTEISYEEPVLMVFKGYVNGKMSVLIQHMSQLSFLLTSLDKVTEEPKRPIGFRIPE